MILDRKQPQRILEHIGAHILSNDVDRLTEPCGLCLRPAPLCVYRLCKTKGKDRGFQIDLKKSSGCPNLIKFSYQSAAKFTDNGPCTNVPIICPLCPEAATAVWKYNMSTHLGTRHPTIPLELHREIYELTNAEIRGMGKILSGSAATSRTLAAKRKNGTQLPISDAHSSRLALQVQ
jgi:hypothetical protein